MSKEDTEAKKRPASPIENKGQKISKAIFVAFNSSKKLASTLYNFFGFDPFQRLLQNLKKIRSVFEELKARKFGFDIF